jgi:hypothetical protein
MEEAMRRASKRAIYGAFRRALKRAFKGAFSGIFDFRLTILDCQTAEDGSGVRRNGTRTQKDSGL